MQREVPCLPIPYVVRPTVAEVVAVVPKRTLREHSHARAAATRARAECPRIGWLVCAEEVAHARDGDVRIVLSYHHPVVCLLLRLVLRLMTRSLWRGCSRRHVAPCGVGNGRAHREPHVACAVMLKVCSFDLSNLASCHWDRRADFHVALELRDARAKQDAVALGEPGVDGRLRGLRQRPAHRQYAEQRWRRVA